MDQPPALAARAAVDADVDADELRRNPFLEIPSPSPKPQFRKEISRARWDEVAGIGEVLEKKGSMWATTGIVRGSKIYCHAEDIMFLAEKGALVLSGFEDRDFSIGDIYKKIACGKNGCSWESFEAYRHLKKLGFIVGRHGIPWTMKANNCSRSSPIENTSEADATINIIDETSLIHQLNYLQINGVQAIFDVYLPNSKFRKSCPGFPNFVLCLCSEYPPTRTEIENLEKRCHGTALKFCHVDHGRVCFFTFDRVELPVLP